MESQRARGINAKRSDQPTVMCRWLIVLFIAWQLGSPWGGINAQTITSGALTGVVTDSSGAVIRGADVVLTDIAKGTTLSTKTDGGGAYLFSFLLPSGYSLRVSHPGFGTTEHVLEVLLGPPATLNVRLALATAHWEVSVTDEGLLVQAENGDAATTVARLQVDEVPNPGNDLTYVAQTAPGVIMNTAGGTGNFSMLGTPGTSNVFTLNGMDDTGNAENVNYSGASNLLLGQNQIQEATVVANGYSGHFAGSAGANINFITKSGGNQFHGNAVYFWNGRVLNANDWLSNAYGSHRPFDISDQSAASFGGPIRKDKLFFFLNTEGLRVLLPSINQVVLPSPQFEAATVLNIDQQFGTSSASDAFYKKMFSLYNSTPGIGRAIPGSFSLSDPLGCAGFVGPGDLGTNVPCAIHFLQPLGRPNEESLLSGRVDWNLRTSDRLFFLLQYDHGNQAYYTDVVSPLFNIDSKQPWWQSQISETHTFGQSSLNQLLVAGTWFDATWAPDNPSETFAAFPTDLLFVTTPFSSLGGMDNSFPSGHVVTRYQITDDVVKIKRGHKLGFGANFSRIYWSASDIVYNRSGTLLPLSTDAFYQGGIDPNVVNGSDSTDFTLLYQTFSLAPKQRLSFYNFGFYAQDEWRLRPNLTLTLALRAERHGNPACERNCFGRSVAPFDSMNHDPDQPYNQAILTNQGHAFGNLDAILWSPRFSFAWQPRGVLHNIVLRGGIGVFYDSLPGYLAENFIANPPLVNSFEIYGHNLTPNENSSLFKVAAQSNSEFLSGFAAGQSLAHIKASDSFFSQPGLVVADSKIHSPQYQKWSLQLQQTFTTATSITVGYFGNHGVHELLENPSANAFGFGSFPSALCASPPVPPCADPRFSEVTEVTTPGVSNYNGFVASFEHQVSRWGKGVFQANYTYGHALDEVSNGGLFQFTGGSALALQNPNSLRSGYGPADYDVRHSFNASYVWELPLKRILRNHGSDYLVKGWQMSGTVFARTGFPYSVFDSQEASVLHQYNYFSPFYAVPARPLSGTPCGKSAALPQALHPCQPPELLPDGSPNLGAAFLQVGCETGFNQGNLGPSGSCSGAAISLAQGRNRFRGPTYFNTDFTILKSTRLPRWENAELGIGFQFFNILNHANFGLPNNDIAGGQFGDISSLAQPPTSILGSGLAAAGETSPRMIQLKAELKF